MLAQAVVQHQGQGLFQPVQADGPEWDVHVVVRAFDDQSWRLPSANMAHMIYSMALSMAN